MGRPTKGNNERIAGSWLAAQVHLETEIAGLGIRDFFLWIMLYRPFLQRAEDSSNKSRHQLYTETGEKGKDEVKPTCFLKFWKTSNNHF